MWIISKEDSFGEVRIYTQNSEVGREDRFSHLYVVFSIIEIIVLGSGKELGSRIEWYKAHGPKLISKLAPLSIARIELASVL